MIVEINLWKICLHTYENKKYWVLYKYIYDIVSHYVYSPKMALCTKIYITGIKIYNICNNELMG